MTHFNLERTRAPRRRTPPWVFLAALLLLALIGTGLWIALRRPAPKSDGTTTAPAPTPVASSTTPSSPTPAAPPAPAPAPTARATAAPAAPSAPATAPAAGALASRLTEAEAARDAGDYLTARQAGLALLATATDPATRNAIEALLNEVNIGLVLSPRAMPEKIDYTVQPGDSLDKIARKFGTTIELLKKSNNISGSVIRVGDRMRILQGQFHVYVSKSDNDLVLTLNGDFFKRYPVGTGEFNKTPVGDFLINDRIAQPTWWRPDGKAIPFGDPENLLGTHWLSINVKGYGLHGTWNPETIGYQLSAGCVRMINDDIEQLFTLLPLGTPVSIRD
jgi:lipoprotein-anchoring transpeptidase ErfK/SrfK